MNGSIYGVIGGVGLILILDQIASSILTLDKINDLVTDTYNKERRIRLYGEVLSLKNNIIDAHKYIGSLNLEDKSDLKDTENIEIGVDEDREEKEIESEDDIFRNEFLDELVSKKRKSYDFMLKEYLEDIDYFLDRNESFKYLSVGDSYRYTVVAHKQENPLLDNNYPNWYFRFHKE